VKLLFENWRKFLYEDWAAERKKETAFDPSQEGSWFELSTGVWRAFKKTGVPEGTKIGFDEHRLEVLRPGVNPFEDQGRSKTWDPSDGKPPTGLYIYLSSETIPSLREKSKWLNNFFEEARFYYPERNANATGLWRTIDELFMISDVPAGAREEMDALIKHIYESAVSKILKQFDPEQLGAEEGLFYHITPKNSGLKEGFVMAPYFTGAKERDRMGAETDELQGWEELLESARPGNAPSRLNTAFGFPDATSTAAYNRTWKGEIWLAKALGETVVVDMRIPEELESIEISMGDWTGKYHDDGEPYDEEELARNKKYLDQFDLKIKELVKKYWAGEPGTRKPVWEVLVGPPGLKLIRRAEK